MIKCLLITGFHFDALLYSDLITKSLMRVISNVHAGRRFPTHVLEVHAHLSKCWRVHGQKGWEPLVYT